VGSAHTASGDTHAFLWDRGSMVDLNNLIATGSVGVLQGAAGINDAGQILCSSGTNSILLTPTTSGLLELLAPDDSAVVSAAPIFSMIAAEPPSTQVKYEIEVTQGDTRRTFDTGFHFLTGQAAAFQVPMEQGLP